MKRALILAFGLLFAVEILAQEREASVNSDDPTYSGEGVTYRVIKLIPIPKVPDEEIRTNRPSPRHIWIPGYWERAVDDWRWVRGRWALPPEDSATWQPGHWRRQGDEWDWTTGNWIVTDTYKARKEVETAPP